MIERTPTHRRQCDRDAAAIHYQAQADVAELLVALKGLSAMYAQTWDRVDGCLLMLPESVERFEAVHAKAEAVIRRIEGKS